MTNSSHGGEDKRRNRDEDMRTPSEKGGPPRPATEPKGSEGSSTSRHTKTDPATGEIKSNTVKR